MNKPTPQEIEAQMYEDMYSDDYIERSYNEQSYMDRLDYAEQMYRSGRIDETQRAEMRMGA